MNKAVLPAFRADLKGHSSGIYALKADGNLLFSASGDGMVGAWDTITLEPSPFSIKVGLPVYALLVQNDRLLIGQGSGGIHVIDRQTRTEVRHLQFHQKGVFDIIHNHHQGHYYSAGGGGALSVFSDRNFDLLLQIPLSASKLRKLLMSKDGNCLLVGSSDGYIRVLETAYMNELASIEAHTGGVYSMQWLADGRLITGGRDAHLKIWEFGSCNLKLLEAIPAHNYAIYDIALADGNSFFSAARDRMVKRWDIENLHEPARLLSKGLTTHANSVNCLLVHRNKLYSAGDDRIIKVWDLA